MFAQQTLCFRIYTTLQQYGGWLVLLGPFRGIGTVGYAKLYEDPTIGPQPKMVKDAH